MNHPTVDDEFDRLLRPLSPEEYSGLERRILADGEVLDSLKVWQGLLIDGRHRLKIAVKHGLAYKTTEMSFKDRDEAKLWIISHQIDRRNIGDSAVHSLRMRVLASMKAEGATIQEVAERLDVTPRTVHRARECVNIIASMPEDIRQRVEEGSLISSIRALQQYDDMDEDEKEACHVKVRANPDRQLQQCMPAPKKVKPLLTPEQMEAVNENLSGKTRQLLAVGAVAAPTPSEIKSLEQLNPTQRATVDDLLATKGAGSIKEAITVLDLAKKKPTLPADATKINEKISDLSIKLMRSVDDLAAALNATSSHEHESVIDSIKIAISKWRSWTKFTD